METVYKCWWGATSFFNFLKFSFKIYSTTSACNCKQALLDFSDSSVKCIRLLPILAGCFDCHYSSYIKSMKLCLKVMFHNQKDFSLFKRIWMLIIPKLIIFSQNVCSVNVFSKVRLFVIPLLFIRCSSNCRECIWKMYVCMKTFSSLGWNWHTHTQKCTLNLNYMHFSKNCKTVPDTGLKYPHVTYLCWCLHQ